MQTWEYFFIIKNERLFKTKLIKKYILEINNIKDSLAKKCSKNKNIII